MTFNFPVSCSCDFNVAATKYFYGLEDGEVPLALLFSGTMEAACRLPVRIWQSMMDQFYPDTTWLRVGRNVFGELYHYKRQNGFASWDETLRSLLPDRPAEARQ